MSSFASRLIAWQQHSGRHDLPWQVTDPYRVWLSEIMLQQTQVGTVIPYFLRFIERFPDVASLAAASQDEVLALWSGLGYYSRARNLHRAAQWVESHYHGQFPDTAAELMTLPGVGRSTAAAIAVFAFGAKAAILDGNVRRVLARWAGIEGYTGDKPVADALWALAERLLPQQDLPAYTQGLMDLGTVICAPRRVNCAQCPVAADCVARLSERTQQLPTPKRRKSRPERYTVMLQLQDAQGRIWLERRPASGIWGGLWSLPETADTLNAARFCQEHLGLNVVLDEALAEFSHDFTHFRLTITPLPGRVAGASDSGSTSRGWFTLSEALALGLPAPVRWLLTNRHS